MKGQAQTTGDSSSAKKQRRPWYALAGVIAFVAVLVWAVVPGGQRAEPGFYQVAAQIIPVIILALAVERLWIGWSWRPRAFVLAPLVLGEIAALSAAALAKQPVGGYDVEQRVGGYDVEQRAGGYVVRCSGKLIEALNLDTNGCARTLTDILGALTAFGLIIGLIAVLLTTLAERRSDPPTPSQLGLVSD